MISFIDGLSGPENTTSILRLSQAPSEWYDPISRDALGGAPRIPQMFARVGTLR
jgi:hypothetical protein